MRARTPRNTGTLKNIGKFPSLKNRKTIWFESHLERDFIYLAEFDKDILQYQEQPLKIKYFFNEKFRSYTPDFLVYKKDHKQLIEIKPQLKAEKKEFVVFSAFMSSFLLTKGYEYLVVTDYTIRREPKLTNIKLLWRFARVPISAKHQILIQKLFGNSSSFLLSELFLFLLQSNQPKELVYTFLFHGYLLIDIEKPITEESIISIGDFR